MRSTGKAGKSSHSWLLRAHVRSRLAEDLSSHLNTLKLGGWWTIQREVLREPLDLRSGALGEKLGLEAKLVWGTIGMGIGPLRVWLSSPR